MLFMINPFMHRVSICILSSAFRYDLISWMQLYNVRVNYMYVCVISTATVWPQAPAKNLLQLVELYALSFMTGFRGGERLLLAVGEEVEDTVSGLAWTCWRSIV